MNVLKLKQILNGYLFFRNKIRSINVMLIYHVHGINVSGCITLKKTWGYIINFGF